MSEINSSIESSTILDRWKVEIISGNQCVMANDFKTAACRYEFARQCADALFQKWRNPYEAASALVVTYHNLADLQRKLGNSDGIRFYLEKVHKTILKALLATSINDERHDSLLSASKRTYSALISYKKCGVYV